MDIGSKVILLYCHGKSFLNLRALTVSIRS